MYILKPHTSVTAQVLHICRQRSSSLPPLRADYAVQASHCDSAEQAGLGIAMEVPQVVGSHVGGLCDDSISELEVCTIFNHMRTTTNTPLYSWSTLLLPILVQWPIPLSGTELNMGSIAFATKLSDDLNANSTTSGM
jgi:hypothetical protein